MSAVKGHLTFTLQNLVNLGLKLPVPKLIIGLILHTSPGRRGRKAGGGYLPGYGSGGSDGLGEEQKPLKWPIICTYGNNWRSREFLSNEPNVFSLVCEARFALLLAAEAQPLQLVALPIIPPTIVWR